jgi:hypothetical protein
MNELKPISGVSLYDADLWAWSQDQAHRLRMLKPPQIDWENVAEEIESLGRSDKRELATNLRIVLLHLIRWKYQPRKRKSGWLASIREHRYRIEQVVNDSPSLGSKPGDWLAAEYARARQIALDETGLSAKALPARCPFSVDQVLDLQFLP